VSNYDFAELIIRISWKWSSSS